MDEFELIRRFFVRQQRMPGVAVGIGDDGAVLTPSPGLQLVQVVDTLVEQVHFPTDTDAADIAYRSVVVNLSDIAAMGARPRWMTLALTISEASEQWLESFSRGLFEAADKFNVALVGGDTTSGPVITVTVTITAEVEAGRALLRSGAQPGDAIFVTGTLGDAAAGLTLLQRGEFDQFLVQRFLRPTPRVAAGRSLVGRASGAIDVSDGLAADLGKLLLASSVGGEIDIDTLPMSAAICERFSRQQRHGLALRGGDDYELCFTAPSEAVQPMDGISRIGSVTKSSGLVCTSNNVVVPVDASGYRHFQ